MSLTEYYSSTFLKGRMTLPVEAYSSIQWADILPTSAQPEILRQELADCFQLMLKTKGAQAFAVRAPRL